jgi:hypothetical protein
MILLTEQGVIWLVVIVGCAAILLGVFIDWLIHRGD